MTFNFYSVKDNLVGEYGTPFIAPNDAVAIRSFVSMVKQAQFGTDLDLYRLDFAWDNELGATAIKNNHEIICRGAVELAKGDESK